MRGNVLLINISPKVLRSKLINRYIHTDYSSDIDEGVVDYKYYDTAVFRPIFQWNDTDRRDLISYQEDKDSEELQMHIKIGEDASNEYKSTIVNLVKKYWDCFCKKQAKRHILNYKFSIDTGTAKPVCCKKPRYGPYSLKIIMEHVKTLLGNDWIERYEGP